MRGAAVAEIVAIHAGNHHVAQVHGGGHARDIGGLSGIETHILLGRRAFGHRTESAAAGTQIAEDHEGGRAAREAFVDIRDRDAYPAWPESLWAPNRIRSRGY